MPRFAILCHDGPRGVHWDLLLEAGGTLRTWALEQEPAPGVAVACEAIPDHRLLYLDYEGPVSGGRGTVACWDSGTYEVESETADGLTVQLSGQRLCGRAMLTRQSGEGTAWRFLPYSSRSA